jgi:hypothetical protein
VLLTDQELDLDVFCITKHWLDEILWMWNKWMNKFFWSKSLCIVSKKAMLNMLHILLGLEIVSFSTRRCSLQVNVLLKEPLSLFTNFHNTLGVLFELITSCWMQFFFAIFIATLYSILYALCFIEIVYIFSFVLAVITLFIQGTLKKHFF